MNVAVTRFRVGGMDANGDDGLPAAGEIKAVLKNSLKLFFALKTLSEIQLD